MIRPCAPTALNQRFAILILLLILILAVAWPATGVGAADLDGNVDEETIRLPDFAAIDAYIEAEISATHIPGLALAIVQGDQIAHLRGFGVADPSGRLMTPQTPLTIGSVSKTCTSLAIM